MKAKNKTIEITSKETFRATYMVVAKRDMHER